MGPKGKKCWCVIIPNLMWWFSKDKSLIWHRTPYEKKTSSPLLRQKIFSCGQNWFLRPIFALIGSIFGPRQWSSEIDISTLSKLSIDFRNFSSFKTFAIFEGSENLVSRKSISFGFEKFGLNFFKQASWRWYEIRQSPTCLCTTFNFLTKTTIETFQAGHLGRHLTTTSGEKYR